MSQYQQSSNGIRRQEGGGSVKRARDMLNAGVRVEDSRQQNNAGMSVPSRPQQAYGRNSSHEAEIEIGFRVENDPRGPVPILPIQGLSVPRHSGPPPPSRRRAPSSVYSRGNTMYFSPIPEENTKLEQQRKGSYASSMAMPTSWGSGPPMSEILNAYESEPDDKQKRDSLVILRQASLGKRGRPSLRTISKSQSKSQTRAQQNQEYPPAMPTRSASVASSSTNGDSIDLEKERIVIENEQKARNIGINAGLSKPGAGMSSKKLKSQRPPTLDMDAVRAADVHGSLTSLPDLIRRATKVATNLEHGRTASRLGVLDMFGKDGKRNNTRASASLSDILASFPPPRTGTPDEKDRSSWPAANGDKSRLREVETSSWAEDANPHGWMRRRFWGIPLPLFILISIVAIGIVAAAIIIPIVLIVIPRSRNSGSNANDNTFCEQQLPCMNGGVSIQSGSSCACVCVDGFSGMQCGASSDGSCATTGTTQSENATVGSSLPALFTQSQTDFNIPLNETEILGLFNTNNISCTVQNALVEFGGISSSKLRRDASPVEVGHLDDLERATEVKREAETQAVSTYVPPILNVPTSTAAADAGPVQPVASPTSASSAPSAAPASTTPSPSPSTTASLGPATQRVYEFARVAVLFIFEQTEDINAATTAQKNIDLYLLSEPIDTATNMNMSVSMPETFVLNFTSFTITLSNGTILGGGNGSAT